jgi:DNA polymerase
MREIVQQLEFFSDLGVTHLNVQNSARPVSLEEIREEIGDCRRCKLCEARTHIVFGVGDPSADLMFVGEAPGADEDVQGIPFVGRAGQLLTRIIQAIDLQRDQVYITNIVKCRPPTNRDPQPDEIATCQGFLFKQIEAIRPKIIVALGRYAAQTLLSTGDPISRIRGKFFDYRGSLLIPTFHPSYLLRNPSAKREVWEDMKAVRARLKERGGGDFRDEQGVL